jgi:hypothetical protein
VKLKNARIRNDCERYGGLQGAPEGRGMSDQPFYSPKAQASLRLIVFSSLLCTAACGKDLPPGPSELETGITVYEHANYEGESAHITSDIADLDDYKGPCVSLHIGINGNSYRDSWDDCISSVRVAPGWIATLYRGPDYGDDQVTVTNDVPNLTAFPHDCIWGGLNDCVTSIRVRPDVPRVTVPR